MTIDVEVWMLAVTAACAVAPWAFSIHAKVAVIASAVQGLPCGHWVMISRPEAFHARVRAWLWGEL
jgi:pimeloyl-ACP methyl ester carboxylesterase